MMKPYTPKSTCYLIVSLKPNGTPFPTFHEFRFASSSGSVLSSVGLIFADIMSVEAPSYQEAIDRMIEVLKMNPYMWAIVGPWIETTYEAHMARLGLWETRDTINQPVDTAAAICKAFLKLQA